MKRFTQLALVAALVIFCSTTASAQKFGYVNSQELISIMPGRDSVTSQLELFSNELASQLETIQVEFNNKLNDYQTNGATYSDSVRALKEKELTDLQGRFQEFQTIAQQDMQAKQAELMTPIIKLAGETVEKVCKDAGLLATFDLSAGALIYQDTTAMVNILPLVKAELGIK
ncbi:MAG: OmpH family outer membrane protein [Rikenellaceae bacterium]